MTRIRTACFVAGLAWAALLTGAHAQNPPDKSKADDELTVPFERFAKAYNARDFKALAAVWSENGEYLDEDTGERLEGRKAIVDDYAANLGKDPVRLEIDLARVRRLGTTAAMVEGTARILKPEAAVTHTRFVAVLVKHEGQWLLDQVRESTAESDRSSAEHLQPLAWMNGDWASNEGDTRISMECREVANGNFRTHRFQVRVRDQVTQEGTLIIGWDAAKKQLRGWLFSSDGSFGEGTIEARGDRSVFHVVGTLPSGDKSSATQTITRKGDDRFTFESADRTVATRVLPDQAPVTLVKVTEKERSRQP